MTINEELLAKFDRIQDLPVSEEMLGAYLEGNLDCYDMQDVSELIRENNLLRTISEDVIDTSINLNRNDDLLDVGMENDSVLSEIGDASDMGCNMLCPDADLVVGESYIEDSEAVENNESNEDYLLDDSMFELPEIPFF